MYNTQRACVIGAGPQGLAALKNLLDLNDSGRKIFDAEILESRSSLGGFWCYSDDPRTLTTLKSTISNTSKWRNCYSDFPVNEAWEMAEKSGSIRTYPTQEETLMYLEQYSKKFGLEKHIRFDHRVCGIARSADQKQWEVIVTLKKGRQPQIKLYDKVIVATGQNAIPHVPIIENIEQYTGDVMHTASFKSAGSFHGKKVLVVGFSSTAADIATELAGTAKKIYLSHRRGNNILPRVIKNRPLDQSLNRRAAGMKSLAFATAPLFTVKQMDKFVAKMCDDAWKGRLLSEWSLKPAPSLTFSRPIISDTLVPVLENGTVESVSSIRKFNSSQTIELNDGSTISANAIIFCTGYRKDKILSTVVPSDEHDSFPRLYQNIFPPEDANSLAYMTHWYLSAGISESADLIGMAIAQVFAGRYILPSKAKMYFEIDRHKDTLQSLVNYVQGSIPQDAMENWVDEGPWRAFLQSAAGTGVNEKLGYGWEGWNFWWNERELCNLLMTGVDSPHVQRLFKGRSGGRLKWHGALEAIKRANQEVSQLAKG